MIEQLEHSKTALMSHPRAAAEQNASHECNSWCVGIDKLKVLHRGLQKRLEELRELNRETFKATGEYMTEVRLGTVSSPFGTRIAWGGNPRRQKL